jgi:2,4-dienoyl-CoA reductase (NADPH2)
MNYPKLFEPIQIGMLFVGNRIVMPPMTTNFAKQGEVTDAMIAYYATRSRGGAGLIVIEDAIVDSPVGHHTYDCLLIDQDRCIPGLRALAKAVQKEGSKIFQNINHGGRRAGRVEKGQLLVTRGSIPVAPSPLAHPVTGFVVPRQMTIEDIEETQGRFVQAARRVCEAGFDGLSIHAAHMYLISEYLSPVSNRRTDRYGGSLENRMRFLTEIIEKVKKEVGNDYPMMVRINGREGLPGSLTPEDAADIAVCLEKAGVHCVSLSCGAGIPSPGPGFATPVAPGRLPHGLEVHLASTVKQRVTIPVMTANRIVTPQEAEEILSQGKADLIGIGRGVISDPEWPNKAREGREGNIRFCIGCMYCMKTVLEERTDMRCTVNAEAGQEAIFGALSLAGHSKKVFVIGGGPAGMEAARVSAMRGHDVTLFAEDQLGGQLNMAMVPPGKQDIRYLIEFEDRELQRLGVNIRNESCSVKTVQEEKPTAVVLATGGEPIRPKIPGIGRNFVMTAWQVLKKQDVAGTHVVIIGGGQVGLETAEYLACAGKKVSVVEQLEAVGVDMERTSLLLLMFHLGDLGVATMTKAMAKEITSGGVLVDYRGKETFLEADTVVLAMGTRPKDDLTHAVEALGIECHRAGDCINIRGCASAIAEGFDAAMKL